MRQINLREALSVCEWTLNRFPGWDLPYWEKLRKKLLKLILEEQISNYERSK